MIQGGFVYILASKTNSVLYVGVTQNLGARLAEHRSGKNIDAFTRKYNIHKLVFYRAFATITEAIAEEKRIKGGSRAKKTALVESINPGWIDLWEECLSPVARNRRK
ncbi:MAG: GIY-YIG nuclease family protein [Sphingobacteriales bacterium]|nr:MAG: GIY-YIG nuclease family protein [Sphingobacteriales bacterium]